VVIVGAGEVGWYLAERLGAENHDVVLVERDEHIANAIAEALDVQVVVGDGCHPSVLQDAGIERAALLAGVTQSDEVNLIASLLAKQHGVARTVVRIQTEELRGPRGTDLLTAVGADVVIDFSLPAGFRRTLAWCREARTPLVIGTTGLTDADDAAIDAAAGSTPVLRATNFSLVVNVLHELIARAAPMLGPGYDIEVMEAHHRFKKDAPSGTALSLARTACDATGRDFAKDVLTTRSGDDVPRQANDITVQSIRIGDHPGEHTVYFAAPGERLELKHVSTSRDSYATGALRAAKWLASQPAGRYGMKDVLGI